MFHSLKSFFCVLHFNRLQILIYMHMYMYIYIHIEKNKTRKEKERRNSKTVRLLINVHLRFSFSHIMMKNIHKATRRHLPSYSLFSPFSPIRT